MKTLLLVASGLLISTLARAGGSAPAKSDILYKCTSASAAFYIDWHEYGQFTLNTNTTMTNADSWDTDEDNVTVIRFGGDIFSGNLDAAPGTLGLLRLAKGTKIQCIRTTEVSN